MMKNTSIKTSIVLFFLISLFACNQSDSKQLNSNINKTNKHMTNPDTATFAMGCFWCSEAIFQDLKGVQSVQSGYAGGTVKNPAYREVCNGTTGHAEAIQVVYDTTKITFAELLEIFWASHDPTTLNRQGHDVGTQYRSGVFYHSEEQKALAETYKNKLEKEKVFDSPIVTEIMAYTNFFKAEDYHADYFKLHGEEPYCTNVVRPKVEKFRKVFKDKLK